MKRKSRESKRVRMARIKRERIEEADAAAVEKALQSMDRKKILFDWR